MFQRILVLCYGNICRSPAAEAWFRNKLPSHIEVDSAGIGALVGRGADDTVKHLMDSHGVSLDEH